jgi:hypothetical protein
MTVDTAANIRKSLYDIHKAHLDIVDTIAIANAEYTAHVFESMTISDRIEILQTVQATTTDDELIRTRSSLIESLINSRMDIDDQASTLQNAITKYVSTKTVLEYDRTKNEKGLLRATMIETRRKIAKVIYEGEIEIDRERVRHEIMFHSGVTKTAMFADMYEMSLFIQMSEHASFHYRIHALDNREFSHSVYRVENIDIV